MTDQERAEHAQRLLADPLLAEVFSSTREAFVAKLEASGMADYETHHEIALCLQILGQVKARLVKYVQDGENSQYQQAQQSFMERLRQRIDPRDLSRPTRVW